MLRVFACSFSHHGCTGQPLEYVESGEANAPELPVSVPISPHREPEYTVAFVSASVDDVIPPSLPHHTVAGEPSAG